MAGSTYDTLQGKQNELILKANKGSVFVAPRTATHIATLTDTTDSLLMPLPTDYRDLGWLNEDGASFSSDIDSSDVTSWGSVTPTRSDITQEITELSIVAQETNLWTIGLHVGINPSTVTAASNGEVVITKPARPQKQSYRMLALAVDDIGDGEIYIARYWPNAEVTDKDDFVMSSGDDPMTWAVTMSARPDSTMGGSSERWLFGGPGWLALAERMGFTVTP